MRGAYLAALLLPEDGRWGVSCGAALKGDATPLGGKLISGLGGNLRWNWKRRTEHEYRGEGGLPKDVKTAGFEVCAAVALFFILFSYVNVLIGVTHAVKRIHTSVML